MSALDQRRPVRQKSVLVLLAFVFAGVVTLACLCAPFLDFFDPNVQRLTESRRPADMEHWLGTDELGRDVLARVIHGTAATVLGPAIVALSAMVISVPLSLVAASRGGWIEAAIMRLADTLLAMPSIIVVVVVVGLFGGSYALAVGVLIVLIVPGGLRIIRAAAIGQQSMPYLEAVRVMGAGEGRVMFVHVLPNLVPTVVATVLLDFTGALIALSSLAFLGLGAPPGSSDWATMLTENLRYMYANSAAAVVPAVLIILTAYSATTIGDWLYSRYGGPQDVG